MRGIVAAATVVLASLAATGAAAADWRDIGLSAEPTFIDQSSIRMVDGFSAIRLAWYRRNETGKTTASPPKSYFSSKVQVMANCKGRQFGTKSLIRYAGRDGLGDVLETRSLTNEQTQLSDVVPDSVGEGIMEYMCAAPLQ